MTVGSVTRKIPAWARNWRVPLAAFFTTRFVLLILGWLIDKYQLGTAWWGSWDADHYVRIAKTGYTLAGEGADGNLVAFYPLFPACIRALTFFTGLDPVVAAHALCFVFGLAGILAFHTYVEREHGREVADNASLLFVTFPMSVFLSATYTESLFFMLLSITFLLLRERRFGAAALVGSLCPVTRMTGVILLPAFAYVFWRERQRVHWTRSFGLLALMLIPLSMYVGYLQYRFNDPFAMFTASRIGWQKVGAPPWVGLELLVTEAFNSEAVFWRIDLLFLVAVSLAHAFAWRFVRRELWIFGFGVIILTLSSNWILGTSRYLMLALPFYIYGGHLLANRPTLRMATTILASSWMAFNAVLFLLEKNIY